MGIYYHTYAGPALVCQYHFNETVTKKVIKFNGCTNPACKCSKPKHELGKAKFCPQCGNAVVLLEVERESRKTTKSVDYIADLMSEGGFREDTFREAWGGLNNEDLIEGYDVFYPEGSSFETRNWKMHVRNPDIAGEIARFESRYAKEIALLRTKYDTVAVEWVVLTDGS